MPARVQCPSCRSRFDLAEHSPRCLVRCPECSRWGYPEPDEAEAPPDAYVMQGPAPRGKEADGKAPGRPSRRRRDDDEGGRPGKAGRRMPPQFAMVHLGLWFYSARVVGSLLSILVEVVTPLLVPLL